MASGTGHRRARGAEGHPAAPDLGPAAPRSPRTRVQFETYAALLQVAEELQRGFAELLKDVDLSPAQYNVLRVLRGAGPAGLACGEVGAKLIRHDPDVTRLTDRLERRKLVERSRHLRDRRVVITRLTEQGTRLLHELDGPVDALHERQMGHMTQKQLASLASLLQEARARLG